MADVKSGNLGKGEASLYTLSDATHWPECKAWPPEPKV